MLNLLNIPLLKFWNETLSIVTTSSDVFVHALGYVLAELSTCLRMYRKKASLDHLPSFMIE